MRTAESGIFELGRAVQAALVSVLAALLVSACGNGGESQSPPQSGAAPTATAQDAEWLAAAEQVAADGGDAALAVEALREVPADGLGLLRRTRQVIMFGDSLSDVGTYKVGVIAQVGGGKFTTNPGPVWPETLGILLRARVTPFRQGFGGVSQVLGGTGFAMGGARVLDPHGVGCNPDPTTDACTAALTVPIVEQISDYLSANEDHFRSDQLVLVFAGANDVFAQLDAFQLNVAPCLALPPEQVDACVVQAQGVAVAAVQQAAVDLAGQVKRILGKGGTRVVVLNLPDMSQTPGGKAEALPVRQLIAGMMQVFNGTLASELQGTGATLLDFYAEFNRVLGNPGRYHVSEINVPACDPAKIADITQGMEKNGSSLFCSPLTLVQYGAALHYLFADGVHPTTLGHLIITRFVLIELWKRRLLL